MCTSVFKEEPHARDVIFEMWPWQMIGQAVGWVLAPEDLLQADLAAPDLALDQQEAGVQVPDPAHPEPPAHPHRGSSISVHSERV